MQSGPCSGDGVISGQQKLQAMLPSQHMCLLKSLNALVELTAVLSSIMEKVARWHTFNGKSCQYTPCVLKQKSPRMSFAVLMITRTPVGYCTIRNLLWWQPYGCSRGLWTTACERPAVCSSALMSAALGKHHTPEPGSMPDTWADSDHAAQVALRAMMLALHLHHPGMLPVASQDVLCCWSGNDNKLALLNAMSQISCWHHDAARLHLPETARGIPGLALSMHHNQLLGAQQPWTG